MQTNEETSRTRRGSPTTRAVKCLKKTVAGVLSAVMVFTGMPTITALADDDPVEPVVIETIGVLSETELNGAIAKANTEGGSYMILLEDDITLTDESDMLTVTNKNAVVTILGNGHTITDNDETATHVLGASGGTLNLGVESGSNAILEETWSNALTITSNKEEHATALIYVTGGTVNMYDGVELKDNHVSDSNVYGGAVHIEGGTFNMYGGEIDGCSAHYGGAIAATGGTLNITGGEIDKNDAVGGSSRGSAIYVTGSDTEAYISNITIEGNELGDEGGETEAADEQLYGTVCFYSGCKAVLDNVTIQNNISRDGGGIYINGSDVTVKNSTITGNQSVHSTNTNGAGGGIYATGSSAVLTVDKCVITGNSATGSGGGVFTNNLSYVTVKDSTISNNTAGAEGAGLRIRNSSYVGSDNFTISGCEIVGNKTTMETDEGDTTFVGGGGVFTSYVYGTIDDCTITDNYSERGGGICVYVGGRVDVKNSTISGNEAVRGGGMYTQANATLDNTEISGNTANVGGGWLIETQVDYAGTTDSGVNPVIEITNSQIVNNTAEYSENVKNVDEVNDSCIGGGINLVSGNVTATEGNVIANNTADKAAADVYVGPYHNGTRSRYYEPTLSLIDAAEMDQDYEADQEGQTIDGWYIDKSDDRYEPNANGEKYLYDGYAEIDDEEGEDPVYLVASYSYKEYNVSFATDVNGSFEEIEGNPDFTFTVRGGYTVETAPNAIPNEGYEFDHWLGSDGKSYTTDQILAMEITGDMIFTAIYKEASSEPVEVAYGVLKVVKEVENPPEENISYLFTLELVVESDSDALVTSDDDDETGIVAYSIKNAYNEIKESGVIYLDDIVDDVESPSNATRVELAEFELEDGEYSIYYYIPDGMTFIVTEIIESSNDAVKFETNATMDGKTAGSYVETGYAVTGVMDASRTSEDPITIVFTNSYPSLKVEKAANIEDGYIAKVDDEITYTITVTNDSKITLHDVTVEDPLTDDVWTVKTLKPGASRKFTATYTVTEDDIASGEIINTATATGYDGDGNEISSDPNDDDSTATVPTEESEDESGEEPEPTPTPEPTPEPDREFSELDEEIVPDENDPDSWEKREVVSESTPIEFEMTTTLPVLTAGDLAELASGDFTMLFHIDLDEQLKREPEESDLHITIGGEVIDAKYYSIDINPSKESWGISTLSVLPSSDGCSFHVTVDLAALYNDSVITANDFTGETDLTVFFYADLEGAEPGKTYASTVWYDVYDDDVIIFTSDTDTVYVSIATAEETETDESKSESGTEVVEPDDEAGEESSAESESSSSSSSSSARSSSSHGSSGSSSSSSRSSSSSSGSVTNVNNGKTGHWILEGGYLTLPDGSHPSNEYLNVDGEIWAFYTYGYAVDRDRTEYYTDEAIAAAGYIPEVTGTWETIGWWFEYDDGTYPHDEWAYLEYNGRTDWYHFDVDGWMDDGWFTENGNTYYLHTVYDGTRGHMYTGWHEIDGYWYYFSETDDSTLGALLKDTTTPDGYKVDAEGRWIE